MTDKPILFSGPMVRAILDGRKTVTRPVLKPQPPEWATFCQELQGLYHSRGWAPSGLWQWSEPEQNPLRKLRRWPVHEKGPMAGIDYGMKPLHAPGDRLWVREVWSHTGVGVWTIADARLMGRGGVIYRAESDPPGFSWFSSIHMPREFSRITLEVTGVKVERLQDINEEEAKAEGCGWRNAGHDGDLLTGDPIPTFRRLWDSINAKRPGCSWDDNPWVEAISFRRITP